MAKKKKVSAEEKSKVSSARRAKCLKELEKENENVYNKKHIWMKRMFTKFLKDRFPKTRPPNKLYPSSKVSLSDLVFANCLDWYWDQPKSSKPVIRLLHGYLGRALLKKGLQWKDRPIAQETWTRITKSTKYAEYVSKGATTLSPLEELNLNRIGSGSLLHATAQIIFMLGIWTAGRGLDPLRTKNRDILFENERTVCGVLRPRINHCFLTDKSLKDADKVRKSEAQTLEKSIECGCTEGTNHDETNVTCQISAIQSFFAYKEPLWENFYDKLKSEGKTDAVINEL